MRSEELIYVAEIPDEPPVGSVVLDKDGLAWQRVKMLDPYPSWVPARQSHHGLELIANYWPKLLVDNGPLTLLHEGQVES